MGAAAGVRSPSTAYAAEWRIATPFPLAPPAQATADGASTIATATSAERMARYMGNVGEFMLGWSKGVADKSRQNIV